MLFKITAKIHRRHLNVFIMMVRLPRPRMENPLEEFHFLLRTIFRKKWGHPPPPAPPTWHLDGLHGLDSMELNIQWWVSRSHSQFWHQNSDLFDDGGEGIGDDSHYDQDGEQEDEECGHDEPDVSPGHCPVLPVLHSRLLQSDGRGGRLVSGEDLQATSPW